MHGFGLSARAGLTTCRSRRCGLICTSLLTVYNSVMVCSFHVSEPEARQAQGGLEKDMGYYHITGAKRGMVFLGNHLAFLPCETHQR